MPNYEFMEALEEGEDREPEVIERYYRADDAPELGEVVEVDGRHFVRILSYPQVRQTWRPYISSRLPRWLKGQPCTAEGKPIVSTQRQEGEICSRFGFERE